MPDCARLEAHLPVGACDFPVDPDVEAPAVLVFWNPADAPAIVSLIAELPDVGMTSEPVDGRILDARTDENGLVWTRLDSGDTVVGALGKNETEPIGLLLPFDDDWSIRLAAADRIRRHLIGLQVDPLLTAQRRIRLKHALRCVDGRDADASYRALAVTLFGEARVADEPWKTSSLKAQVARLVAHGRMMVDRGYRHLLRGKSR